MHLQPRNILFKPLPYGLTLEAMKAERTPPLWYRDSVTLQHLLSGAWDHVSTDFVQDLLDAFRAGDTTKIEALLKQLKDLGSNMAEVLGNKPEAVFQNLLTKAESFWRLHASEFGIKKPADFKEAYREKLAETQAQQIKNFAEKYPERILEPEILKQLKYLQETATPDPVTVSTISDRLDLIMERSDDYWEKVTDVHVARTWHADGVKYAEQNGIKTGRITGPLDALTCDVCRLMLGTPVSIETAMDKFDADLSIDDPEAYVEAWAFPRVADVDNISPEERAALGFTPPFHPG